MGDERDEGADEAQANATPHELMAEYEALAEKETEYRRQKRAVLEDIGDDLTAAVEAAVGEGGVSVAVDSVSRDGNSQTLSARLDRASLVAALMDELPDGFVIEHINDDGSLTVQWDERETVSNGRHAGAILKAIVAEETSTDEDGFILDVPTREMVLDRAVDLGIDADLATQRLAHLTDLDVVDIVDGEVYPDSNFSKY